MSKNFPGKIFLLLILCFVSSVAIAQDESDTIVDMPPPPQVVIEEPAAEADEEEQDRYFTRKSQYEPYTVKERRIPDSVWQRLKNDNDYSYATKDLQNKSKDPSPQRDVKNGTQRQGQQQQQQQEENFEEPPKRLSDTTWFQTLLWILIIGGFAGAIAWYLASSNVGLFRKKIKNIANSEGEEEMPEDIFAINYQTEIDKAAASGNYRLAIRLMFLRLLKNMSERNAINYKQDKTNMDYLFEIQPKSYYNDFFRVTRNYEYSWYGKFEVSPEAYATVQQDFIQLEKKLS
jgi:hypothetical protein